MAERIFAASSGLHHRAPSRFNAAQNPPQYAGSFTSSATLNTRPRAVGGSATARAGTLFVTCYPPVPTC